jgi:hypothetical protein
VNPHQSESQAEAAQGGTQSNQAPDSGPNQYGDQSIVNSKSESTNQKGKPGQNGQDQGNKQKKSPEEQKQDQKQQKKGSGQ